MDSARGYASCTCFHNVSPPASLSKPQWTNAPLASPSSICRLGNSPWPSFDTKVNSPRSPAWSANAVRLRASMGLSAMWYWGTRYGAGSPTLNERGKPRPA